MLTQNPMGHRTTPRTRTYPISTPSLLFYLVQHSIPSPNLGRACRSPRKLSGDAAYTAQSQSWTLAADFSS